MDGEKMSFKDFIAKAKQKKAIHDSRVVAREQAQIQILSNRLEKEKQSSTRKHEKAKLKAGIRALKGESKLNKGLKAFLKASKHLNKKTPRRHKKRKAIKRPIKRKAPKKRTYKKRVGRPRKRKR